MENAKEGWGPTFLFFILFFCLATVLLLRLLLPPEDGIVTVGRDLPSKISEKVVYNYHSFRSQKWHGNVRSSPSRSFEVYDVEQMPTAGSAASGEKRNFIYHKVRKGDSLWKIARTYDVEIDSILLYNRIDNPDLIYSGSILIIREKG